MSLVRRTGSQFESQLCHLLAGSSGANHSTQPTSVSSPARWSHYLPLPQRPVQSCTQRSAWPAVQRSGHIHCGWGCLPAKRSWGFHVQTSSPICNYCISSKVGVACCSWLWGWLSLAPFRTENTGGPLGKVRRISRRWGHSASSWSPTPPPLGAHAPLVISPSVDPRTVPALSHLQPIPLPLHFYR